MNFKKGFLFIILFQISILSFGQENDKLVVYWSINNYNDPLMWFSNKLLKALGEGRLQGYSKDGKVYSKTELEKKINPELIKVPFSKEEISIVIDNGDFSVLSEMETNYTGEQLKEILSKGKSIDKLYKFKKRKSFECNRMDIEIQENVVLDTLRNDQKGTIEFINLIIPKYYSKTGDPELFCKIRYGDFEKEQSDFENEKRIISERAFNISAQSDDIKIIYPDQMQMKLSELKSTKEQVVDRKELDRSVFRFFGGKISFWDKSVNKRVKY
jgi:hypothetical protein